jgi:hypothetical protein
MHDILCPPYTQDHYNTVYGDTFQDPKNTLGYGAKSKAEKLKKAVSMAIIHVPYKQPPLIFYMLISCPQAVERGTPVPLMVQFETFDDAVTER